MVFGVFCLLFLVLKTSRTSLVDEIFVLNQSKQEKCFLKVLIKF